MDLSIRTRSTLSLSTKPITLRRLYALLRKLSGSGFTGFADRDLAILEMQQSSPEQILSLIIPLLNHRVLDVRCHAAEAILGLDPDLGVERILPLLNDRSTTLRRRICGLLYGLGDTRAIVPLIERLQKDPRPQVRVVAASALGGIGSFQAVRALVEAEQNDHKLDSLGHSASSASTVAISRILMREAIRIVETYQELTVALDHEPNIVIQASITRQSTGQAYRQLPRGTWGPTTGCFDPSLVPIHDSPFTVDITLKQEEIQVRRVFIFQVGETGWSVSTVIRPDLLDSQELA
jgi:hypothetical protein